MNSFAHDLALVSMMAAVGLVFGFLGAYLLGKLAVSKAAEQLKKVDTPCPVCSVRLTEFMKTDKFAQVVSSSPTALLAGDLAQLITTEQLEAFQLTGEVSLTIEQKCVLLALIETALETKVAAKPEPTDEPPPAKA